MQEITRTMKKGLKLKISLRDIEPMIWREVVVNDDLPLPHMHFVIQTIMPWFDSHLHQFTTKDRCYAMPHDFVAADDDDCQGYEQTTIGELLQEKGESIEYEYDFGDSWLHDIVLEEIVPPLLGVEAQYLGGENGAPIEDCGGADGYQHIKEVISNPSHPEYADLCDWMGMEDDMEFDPAYIDIDRDEVNEIFRDEL